MELRELAAFREVAQQSSFTRAANRLGYAQSTVTAQIQSLERDLGARLLDRLPRSVVLTEAGRALLPLADRLLVLAESARAAAANAVTATREPVGAVSVSAPESLLTYRLPAVLQRLRTEYPGVTADLRPTPIGRFRSATRRAVAQGHVDLAVVMDTRFVLSGFSSEVLAAEPVSVIAPAGHRLEAADRVLASDLEGETILLPEAPDHGCAYRTQFEQHLTDAHVSTDSALEFASIETVKQCVAAGIGVSVVPSVAVEADVTAGRIVTLAWRPPFEVFTQMVWNPQRSFGPAQAAFLHTMRAALADTP
jgi:DNA-binding transcriptional LysR family regulator